MVLRKALWLKLFLFGFEKTLGVRGIVRRSDELTQRLRRYPGGGKSAGGLGCRIVERRV